jgi:hypothetical protein
VDIEGPRLAEGHDAGIETVDQGAKRQKIEGGGIGADLQHRWLHAGMRTVYASNAMLFGVTSIM